MKSHCVIAFVFKTNADKACNKYLAMLRQRICHHQSQTFFNEECNFCLFIYMSTYCTISLLIKYSEKNISDLFENCRSILDERRNVFKSVTSVENFCFYIALPGRNDSPLFISCKKTNNKKHKNIKIRTELFRY